MNPLDKWDDWEWERAAQTLMSTREGGERSRERSRDSDRYKYGYRDGYRGGASSYSGRNAHTYSQNRHLGRSGRRDEEYGRQTNSRKGVPPPIMSLVKWTGSQRRVAVAAVFFLLVLFSSYGADKLSQTVYSAYQMGMQGGDTYPVLSSMIKDALGLTGGEAMAVNAESKVFYPPVAGTVKVAFKAKDPENKKCQGVWIASSIGTTVYSPGTGVVTEVGWEEALGRFVRIKLDDGWECVVANFGDVGVSQGDPVQKTDALGTVGSSASHSNLWVYLELRKNGRAVDPLPYLTQGESA